MNKKRKVMIVLLVCLVCGALVISARAQLNSQTHESKNAAVELMLPTTAGPIQKMRGVNLIKNARKNGYKTGKRGKTFYLKANNVVDPLTKKLIEGLKKLKYRCSDDPLMEIIRRNISFSGGNSQRVAVACALISDPQIIIIDEPNSN